MGQRVRLVPGATPWRFCWRTRLTYEMVRDLGLRLFNNSSEPQISPYEQPNKQPSPSAVLWQLRFLWRDIYGSNLHCVPDFNQGKLVGVSAYLIREVETSERPFAPSSLMRILSLVSSDIPCHFTSSWHQTILSKKMTPLTDFTAMWEILPNGSHWVLNTVRKGYRIHFATHSPHFQGVVVTKLPQNETIYFSNKNCALFWRKGPQNMYPSRKEKLGSTVGTSQFPKRSVQFQICPT